MDAQEPCGSRLCTEVVNGLGKVLSDQQDKGFDSVKELMKVHHDAVKDSIAEIKQTIRAQGDIIHPQLRNLDGRLKTLEAKTITEEAVKKAVAENENIIWLSRSRSRTAKVIITVIAGMILSMPVWLKKVLILLGAAKP